jgi:hypothetical protein
MKLRKKASTMPFHWVFVLLAGGAIILLFVMFINTTKVASESSLSGKVILHFDTIFSSLATRDGVESNIASHPDIHLQFRCEQEDTTTFSTFQMKGGISKDINQITIFSQKVVYGDTLFTSISWYDIPFAVGTMVYLTDPNTLYVLSGIKEDVAQLKRLFASGVTYIELGQDGVETLGNISYRGFHDVVVIDLIKNGQSIYNPRAQAPLISNVPANTEVYLYEVRYDQNFLNYGIINGYRYTEVNRQKLFTPSQTVPTIRYTNIDELRGILHSDSTEYARCVLQKAYNNIPRVAEILSKRSELLAQDVPNNVCKNAYNQAKMIFDDIVANSENYAQKSADLAYLNEFLDRQNCPTLY